MTDRAPEAISCPGEHDPSNVDHDCRERVAALRATLATREKELEQAREALRGLLSYALQLELLVYPDATGGTEHDVIEQARAALEEKEG